MAKLRIGAGEIDVRPTLVDRLVSWVNPVAGATRIRSRAFLAYVAGGYVGGRRDRRATRNWRRYETSADVDILPDAPDLRSRSRDLVRNSPVATGAVATAVTNVVGSGLKLQSAIDAELLGLDEAEAKAWQRNAQREFGLFCTSCDFTSVQSFSEMQALIFRSILESGDILVVRRWRRDAGTVYSTRLQLVEADRVSNADRAADTPELVAGVQLNRDGVPVGYQIADRHPGDPGQWGSKVGVKWVTIPARAPVTGRPLALHLFDRMRPGQTRGVPWLAPVIEALKQLSDYSEAELKAAVIAAMFTVFLETEAPASSSDPAIVGSSKQEDVSDPTKEVALEDSGAVVRLYPGETVSTAAPGRPFSGFEPFVVAVLRQVGVALELPFELLIKHFTASYSASRAALEMAWQFFRKRREWLTLRLCQPVYEWAIEEAVALGRLQAPGFFDDPLRRQAWLKAIWVGPARISLDPAKDANAHKTNIETGLESRRQVITEAGGDADAVASDLADEAEQRAALAPAIAPGGAPDNQDGNQDGGDAPADQQDQEDERT